MTGGDGASYAGLGRRLAALLLDSVILLLILFLVFIAMRLLQAVGRSLGARGRSTSRALGTLEGSGV